MYHGRGVYADISNTDYHKDPALGSTSLKTLATRTPAHYLHDQAHPKQSAAFDLGTVAHSLILEQDESGVVVIDVEAKRGKVWTEPAEAAEAAGKIALTAKEWAQVTAMRDSVMAHDVAGPLFTGHRPEHSVFWEEDGLKLKCRPDAWRDDLLVDLKTTVSADPRDFGKTAYNFGYHQSAAHYQDGVRTVAGETLPFIFVLVEKAAPYLVSVVELDEVALDYGRQMNDRAKRVYRECVVSGNWPGYPATEPVGLPMFGMYQLDDLLGLNTEMEIKF
jgi:hypothetical protein